MTQANTVPDIPLDPTKWEIPTQRFFGRINVCRKVTTDDIKDKEGNTFTELRQWPSPGKVFQVEIERHDAVYQLPDGTTAPVKRYLSLDLHRFNEREHKVVPVAPGDNKVTFTLTKWIAAKIQLEPTPEKNEGLDCEFEFIPTKMFRGNAAKNILYPIKVMPKGWTYEGEVEVFQVKEQIQDLAEDSGTPATDISVSSNGHGPTQEMTEADLIALFDGLKADDEDAMVELMAANKGRLSTAQRLEIMGGDVTKRFIDDGKLAVVDGVYQAV